MYFSVKSECYHDKEEGEENKVEGVGKSLYSNEFLTMDKVKVRKPFLVKQCTFVSRYLENFSNVYCCLKKKKKKKL